MLTRRTFVASAAAFGAVPLVAFAQTPEPNQDQWPTIQGEAVDQQRTRLIDGVGLTSQPGDFVTAAEELKFVSTNENNPAMLLSNDIVLSRAMGPDLPLVATDARTGQELWRRSRVSMLLGASDNSVVYVVHPANDGSSPILKAGRMDTVDDTWETDTAAVHGGIIIDNHTLIYTESLDDEKSIIARDITDGQSLWSNDASGFGSRIPSVFASNGKVVIGATEPMYQSIKIAAWSVDTGDLLWEMENDHFLTSPAFLGDDVVILTADGLHRLDATTGQELALFPVPNLRGDLFTMAVTEEAAILFNYSQITSISWLTGEVVWTRPPQQYPESYEFQVCDGVMYALEASTEMSVSDITVRGYNLDDGALSFEYSPTGADGTGLRIAAFLVANRHLYLTSDQGIFTVQPSKNAISEPLDPIISRKFEDTELGFSYSWDESWTATGTSFMTPNGQAFTHESNGAVAAQSAGEAAESDYDFSRNWHANLGADHRYILDIKPSEAPPLGFVPENAEVLGVEYPTTFSAPYDDLFGIRVLMPLSEGNVLTFEFLQAKSLYLETIESFATFFEDLLID